MDMTISQGYAMLGDTMIHCFIKDMSEITVPDHIGNSPVKVIGSAAFVGNAELRTLRLPRSVEQIGNVAFSQCNKLEEIYLPGSVRMSGSALFGGSKLRGIHISELKISKTAYRKLCADSVVCPGNIRVLRSFPTDVCPKELYESIERGVKLIPGMLPDDLSVLYEQPDPEQASGDPRQDVSLALFEDKKRNGEIELKMLERRLRQRIPQPDITEAEKRCDDLIRRNKNVMNHKKRTMFFTFNDGETRQLGKTVSINAIIRIGFFYFPYFSPVIFNGSRYMIYRRCFLSPQDDEMPYVIENVAVFKEIGVVTDRKEAEEVYAKYRIPSVL